MQDYPIKHTRRVWVKCRPADLRTGKLRTELADRVRILPTCVASCHHPLAQGWTSYLAGPRNHNFHGSHSLPPSTAFHLFLPLLLPLLYISSPSLTLEVGSLNTARGLEEHCQWGVGRTQSVNQIRCILPLKSDIWWHQYLNPIFHTNPSPTGY